MAGTDTAGELCLGVYLGGIEAQSPGLRKAALVSGVYPDSCSCGPQQSLTATASQRRGRVVQAKEVSHRWSYM